MKREQIHLTLQFLGYIERARFDVFQSVLGRVSRVTESFQLRGKAINCFPSSKLPRIIWAGLAGELEPLQTLKQTLDAEFGELDYMPEERKFVAERSHISNSEIVSTENYLEQFERKFVT